MIESNRPSAAPRRSVCPPLPQLASRILSLSGHRQNRRIQGRLVALRRVATIESIGSSTRIEGSKLSDRGVERLLSNLEIKSFDTRDEQEVASYAEVMDQLFSSWQDIPFTENHIKPLHQISRPTTRRRARRRQRSVPRLRTASRGWCPSSAL